MGASTNKTNKEQGIYPSLRRINMEVLAQQIEKLPQYLAAANALLMAVIAIAVLIPGEQPEKFLQKIVDLIAKISKK